MKVNEIGIRNVAIDPFSGERNVFRDEVVKKGQAADGAGRAISGGGKGHYGAFWGFSGASRG